MSAATANKKLILIFSLIGLVIIMLFTAAMLIDFIRIQPAPTAELSNNTPVQWKVDPVSYGDHFITITGWALIPGEPPVTFNSRVVLENVETGRLIRIPTMLIPRDELNEQFPDGIDYTQSGFLAKVNRKLIGLDVNTWRVFLDYQNNGHAYFLNMNLVLEHTQ